AISKGKDYQYSHQNTSYINYYRLRMVDLDGKFIYSQVRVIDFKDELEVLIYPNPFEGSTKLMVKGFEKKSVEIRIISAQGTLVYDSPMVSGEYLYIGDQLASGMYMVQVTDANRVITKKIVKH
ncbi:MAG: T9SS type A sorting domain-containing protein, partial [Cytophagales bacterium]|nr:T9SS type A sorting domain-containing protein [Cytophagales bacterium]